MKRRDGLESAPVGCAFWLDGTAIIRDGEPVFRSATNGILPVSIGLLGGSITIESLDGGKTWSEIDDETT